MALMVSARDKCAAALIVVAAALSACEPPEPKLLELAIPPRPSALRREAKVPPAGPTPRPPAANYGLRLSPEGNQAVEDLLQAGQFGFTSGIVGAPTSGGLALETLMREERAPAAAVYLLKKGTPAGKLFALWFLKDADPEAFRTHAPAFRDSTEMVSTVGGCLAGQEPFGEVVEQMEQRSTLRP